jgi:hypothetical protein
MLTAARQILMALALFGDGLLKGMGIILGIEMQDMLCVPAAARAPRCPVHADASPP